MNKILFIFLLSLSGTVGYSTTWTITNSGFSFTPASLTIIQGDIVNFTLESIHDAREVSQATWDINGITALPGGFQTAFGGGSVSATQLGVGTHYYVCSNHASAGMKGVIIVQSSTGIADNQVHPDISIFPNPSMNLITIKSGYNLKDSQYLITDQAGKDVIKGKLLNEATQIDISQLPSGIYFVQIIGVNSRQSFKVMKN